MGQFFYTPFQGATEEYNSLLVNALNRIFKSNLSLNNFKSAAYKRGAFVRSKYYTPFYKTRLKWIPRSKSGASKSRPLWAAHTRIGNVWEYPPGTLAVEVEHQNSANSPKTLQNGLRRG